MTDRSTIQRRRHHQQAQLGTKQPLSFQAEGETGVGLQAAFVKLVEQHGAVVVQARIGLKQPGENPFRDDLDAGLRADLGIQPHPVSDGGSDRLSERGGHALCCGSRRQPTRFEQQQFLAGEPRFIEQSQRDDGSFSSSWRRSQQRIRIAAQRIAERRQHIFYWQRRHDRVRGSRVRQTVADAACEKEWQGATMPDNRRVIDHIRTAFAETEHPGDAFLQGSRQGCEPGEVIAPFQGVRHWSEIDQAILDPNEAALSFFTEGGFRHFLPAFMIADLEGRLQTGDPVFHLTHGFAADKTIEVPAGGRMHRRSTGASTLVNPRLYGAMTWRDHALQRLAVFTREEAGAIVAYLEWARDRDPQGVQRDDINAALDGFWRRRVESAPTQTMLREHMQAETDYVNDLRKT